VISKRVEKQWLEFERTVMPKNAPPIQRQEMKRAFYSGAFMLLQHLKHGIEEDTTDDEGVDILESIEQECVDFMQRGGR
jgi:hypothetical protein